MENKNNLKEIIPKVFKQMDNLLYTYYKSNNYMWLDNMEWLTINDILNYEYEETAIRNFIPFAFTSGGDKWCWYIENFKLQLEDYPVVLCYHDDYIGEFYAKNTKDALFRQIIEFVSNNNFYLGNNKDIYDSYKINQIELTNYLKEWHNKLYNILDKEQLNILENLINKKLSIFNSKFDEICCLIDNNEKNNILAKVLSFEKINEPIEWIK